MKVKDLIEKLKEFDPELSVCLGDWSEGYAKPDEQAAEYVVLRDSFCYPKGSKVPIKTSFICIGNDDG